MCKSILIRLCAFVCLGALVVGCSDDPAAVVNNDVGNDSDVAVSNDVGVNNDVAQQDEAGRSGRDR